MVKKQFFVFNYYMHNLNVLVFGSKNFNTSLEELKVHLKFNLNIINNEILNKGFDAFKNIDVLLVHEDFLNDDLEKKKKILKASDKIKILIEYSKKKFEDIFSDTILLPLNIDDLNKIVEKSIVKKNFNVNSTIQIKNYVLDKNEKKLKNNSNFILLTEKEIQLLELLMSNKNPISKNKILSQVWKYSSDADTHTVETHIYRLRKKIKSKFSDMNFISNYKDGYIL